ncbi:peptide chain release factor 2 [Hydrogenivirga caldilitoris]|uniref:Peptide chain release factor 2 n=1 Tax=Hydrogenivirga caldilitoris TaxID=246264 RepID=A0A497XNF4_9AQUI|nr:peptide chain release factor 2 [Hydrogenivirga caldilitoris]RLJ69834.1 peptide chain release factor 2 [Hydrogenivirga caldilitoris]
MLELKGKIEELKERFEDVRKVIEPDKLRDELKKIDETMSSQGFWEDQENAKKIIQRRKWLEETINSLEDLENALKDVEELAQSTPEEDTETWAMLEEEMETLEKRLNELELKTYLSGDMDSKNAYLTIQAGAGGTEACDWADMLFRMYRRWAERNGYEVEVVDITPDDVAGIKSVTMLIKGPYAYGYLKGEQGVHRLVRISPFDSNARRHTSFAAVSVMPQIDEDINIEIKDEDLKIETFRASGAGGQYVNKTDTAVRITHVPTGIVVSCQQERSQFQNRRKAIELLKAKLYQLEQQKLLEKKKQYEGEKTDIGWGHQIRSYVFHPYRLIKDLRTGYETGNVEAVMDGDIDQFLESFLKWQAENRTN